MVSALLTKKANAGLLIPRLSNALIWAAKTVDSAIVGVEILEHWQQLKVHRMFLEKYLGEGKMELLKREVESSMRHKQMGSCGDRLPKCIICIGLHKMEEYCCRVAGCIKGRGKICIHVTAKCANCGGNYTVNLPCCVSRHKVDIKAWLEKKTREKKRKKKGQASIARDEAVKERGEERREEREEEWREKSLQRETEMDLEDER